MDKGNTVLRLAKPKLKGIFGLLFSRLLLVLVLIVGQLALLVSLFSWFREYLPHYAAVELLFTSGMIIYLFNSAMDSSAKLTWLAVIAVFPFAGALLLFYTQADLGHRAVRARTAELIEATRDTLEQDPAVLSRLKSEGSGLDDLNYYVNRSGCFPVYDHTDAVYFPSGEEKFEAMLRELERAQRYIFLEYFIIEEGYMWGRVLDVLSRKAKEGLDVRVMYDGMCEITTLPHDYPRRLETLGIRAKMFSPVTPIVSTHYNYRDHRKILVIDGKVAFTGGVNLADEYINLRERFGHWKDTAVMLRGDAARSFALMFLQMWNLTEREPDFSPCRQRTAEDLPEAPGFVMPYADCPLDSDKVGESVYMDLLYRATSYVHIMTPYLILDGELETALCYAAERGVDVKIILPGIPDKKAAYALAKSHHARLLESGVRLYEYTPGFVHAKVFVSDDCKAVVGTINLDYRSLYHHFECAAYLYRAACIPEIEADFSETLARCRAVTHESMRRETLFYRFAGRLLKILAPLM